MSLGLKDAQRPGYTIDLPTLTYVPIPAETHP